MRLWVKTWGGRIGAQTCNRWGSLLRVLELFLGTLTGDLVWQVWLKSGRNTQTHPHTPTYTHTHTHADTCCWYKGYFPPTSKLWEWVRATGGEEPEAGGSYPACEPRNCRAVRWEQVGVSSREDIVWDTGGNNRSLLWAGVKLQGFSLKFLQMWACAMRAHFLVGNKEETSFYFPASTWHYAEVTAGKN